MCVYAIVCTYNVCKYTYLLTKDIVAIYTGKHGVYTITQRI